MRGYERPSLSVGELYDVGGTLPDLRLLYPPTPDEALNATRYWKLRDELTKMSNFKHNDKHGKKGRNFWQAMQRGGQGEPFYRDPKVSFLLCTLGERRFAEIIGGIRASKRAFACGSSSGERCLRRNGGIGIARLSRRGIGSSRMRGRCRMIGGEFSLAPSLVELFLIWQDRVNVLWWI
jgi:hypothetical protein